MAIDKTTPNKMMTEDQAKTTDVVDTPITQDYFFPDYGITIPATSLEEAQGKLKEQLNLNK